MDLLGLNKFMVLLWKNFTLKRRQCTALAAELILTVLFVGVLLLTRRFSYREKTGPFNYPPQPVDELPIFLREVPASGVWELAFVPSKSVVVKDIVETVKRDLHYNFKGYISEGFLLMQHALDKAIMKYHNHKTAQQLFTNVHVFVQRFPYPRYDNDFFYILFSDFAPLVILFVFIVNYLTIIQSVVWEKENRLKEYQLMIGLSNWMLWAAYFFTFLTLYLVIIFLTCLLFFVKMKPLPIIQYSDPSLVFVFLLCFAIATIFFSFMVSTFFSKGRAETELASAYSATETHVCPYLVKKLWSVEEENNKIASLKGRVLALTNRFLLYAMYLKCSACPHGSDTEYQSHTQK